jgi:hypothetical protein
VKPAAQEAFIPIPLIDSVYSVIFFGSLASVWGVSNTAWIAFVEVGMTI